MDLHKIKALIDLLAVSSVAELELVEGEDKVHLIKGRNQERKSANPVAGEPVSNVAPPLQAASQVQAAAATQAPAAPKSSAVESVVAPMSGVLQLASAAGAMPFATIGDALQAGQVLCTIEAMKMLHSVETEVAGKLVEVLVRSGDEVQVGQALFRIES